MKRIVIITNIPSPYRVDHFIYLQKNFPQYDFHIVFSEKKSKSDLRQWNVSVSELNNVYFLENITLYFKRKYDDREICLTHGVGKLLKKISPDAVVCMEYNLTIIQTVIWCKFNKVPYISLTDGTLYSERNINKIQFFLRKFIISRAAAFIASSTKAKEKIEYYRNKNRIFVSYLSEDFSVYLQDKYENYGKNILYVGSLIDRKGVDLLLRALYLVKIDWHLDIVGDGQGKKELLEICNRLGISDRVSFLGYKQQIELKALYAKADLFVLPSREDCYGLVIMEAMASSLPVVCSKYVDGAYDLINEKTGRIIDPYDAESFASNIKEALLINCPDNKWGTNGKHRVKKFDFESVSVAFINAIEYVLQ